MTPLEHLTPGSRLEGLVPGVVVTIVAATWNGSAAVTLTYRTDDGKTGERLVYRDDEQKLSLAQSGRPWSFDADGDLFRLASEARRIELAWMFDPYLAVQTSRLEPLPHQLQAVYHNMLDRQPLRFLLADDPGAGKTIMAGLLIKELGIRGVAERVLIVTPGGLVDQWQDELDLKFGLHFEILTREMIESSRTGNPFDEKPHLIARLDQLARSEDDLIPKLKATNWDLCVVDEAHKMSAHYYGNELKKTKRYRLGETLGQVSSHLLLMTATPHSGKEEDFHLFLSLLDSDRFAGRTRAGSRQVDTSDLMRRLVKEKLVRFDGRPLFPERRAYSPHFQLSDAEARLYHLVSEYVREEMNRAERLRAKGEGRRGSAVGFALTILQRRLASSPEAIYRSLDRRRKRLENKLREARMHKRGLELGAKIEGNLPSGATFEDLEGEDFDPDDFTAEELEALEEELVDAASAAESIPELETELAVLSGLLEEARKLRESGQDRKWEELRHLLADAPEMFHADGSRRKLIIFTEHRDTLNYLVDRIGTFVGRPETIVEIHGGVRREERRKIQEAFTQDPEVSILVATDAAGEGLNLQRAHLVVNYDLPWNPNRIEQRFGRVHRIGQTEMCHLWNLVAADTREGDVFLRLFAKLDQTREDLGSDQVFDVLGESFSDRPLRDLLLDAIREGDKPEVRAKLDEIVDAAAGERVKGLIKERALASDALTPTDVDAIRVEIERAEARRIQPQFVRAFFLQAFKHLGGRISDREQGRFEITRVPPSLRRRDRQIGSGAHLLTRYERVTFDRGLIQLEGHPPAEFIAPGHPLLSAIIDVVKEEYGLLLKQGAVLVDESDQNDTPRLLVYLEHEIRDGVKTRADERRVVSRRFEFVETDAAGAVGHAGWAPYLDFRPIADDELKLLEGILDTPWLTENPVESVEHHAIEEAVPRHRDEVRKRAEERVTKARGQIKARLESEIRFWDHRANQLKEQELAGKNPRMNSGRARARADELEIRLSERMAALDAELDISAQPPVVTGGALVIPGGLLERLRGEISEDAVIDRSRETERVDQAAVAAVLAAEERLGREATEMAHHNRGYDVESITADGGLLFIEVKGRIEGATDVTVSRSQIGIGRNSPDQFILALANVPHDDSPPELRYLRRPFEGMGEPHFASVKETFNFKKLWEAGEEPS